MKHLKTSLSLLLVLALAVIFVPAATAAVTTSALPGDSNETVIITVTYDSAPTAGTKINCIIDLYTSTSPKNGLNAGIISTKSADGVASTFTFEMQRPDKEVKGNAISSWIAFYSDDNGNTWHFIDFIDTYGIWEPGIIESDDDLVLIPTVKAVGSFPPSNIPAKEDEVVTLDVTNEKLIIKEDSSFEIAGYSLDGGEKWKKGAPTDKVIASLMKKGGKLVLTDKLDSKGKVPFAGTADDPSAVLLTFSEVKPAPKLPKLTVSYDLLADPTGKTTGCWTLVSAEDSAKEAAAVRKELRIAWTKDGKTPVIVGKAYILNADKTDYIIDEESGFTYGKFKVESGASVSNGIEIAPTTGSKAGKQTYLVKLAAKRNSDGSVTPASKPSKIKVSDQIMEPKLKVNYKTETIKLKNDMTAYFGVGSIPKNANGKIDTASVTADGFIAAAGKSVVNFSSKDAKKPIQLGAYLDEIETSVTVWYAATAQKPASRKQVITLAPRAVLTDTEYDVTVGKIKPNKILEVYDKTTGSYGALQKVSGAYKGTARLKNTAKSNKNNGYTGFAASRSGVLTITWGAVQKGKKSVSGALSAIVVPPAEYAPYLVRISDLKDVTVSGDATGGTYKFPIAAGDEISFTLSATVNGQPASCTYSKGDSTVDVTLGSLTGETTVKIIVTATLTNESDNRVALYAAANKLTAELGIVVESSEAEVGNP